MPALIDQSLQIWSCQDMIYISHSLVLDKPEGKNSNNTLQKSKNNWKLGLQ